MVTRKDATDRAVYVAITLLLVVLAWWALFAMSATAPLRADEFLSPGAKARTDSGGLVLLIEADDRARARIVERLRVAYPGRSITVHGMQSPGDEDRRSRQGRMAALVRAYGYSELPVLLTVTAEGQIARIQPVTMDRNE